MMKFRWRTKTIEGEFEVQDGTDGAAIREEAKRLAIANMSVECINITRPEGPINWNEPIEAVNFYEDGEEIGVARFLGTSNSEGEFTQIVGISWSPPREKVTFALASNGHVKGERDVFIRNIIAPQ